MMRATWDNGHVYFQMMFFLALPWSLLKLFDSSFFELLNSTAPLYRCLTFVYLNTLIFFLWPANFIKLKTFVRPQKINKSVHKLYHPRKFPHKRQLFYCISNTCIFGWQFYEGEGVGGKTSNPPPLDFPRILQCKHTIPLKWSPAKSLHNWQKDA